MLCTSCGVLVGVNDPTCYNCGRRNPGLWGFAPALRAFGNDLGFINIVTGGTIVMYVLSLVMSRDGSSIGLEPNSVALQILGGTLTEIALRDDRLDGLIAWCKDLGIAHVEVSDGTIALDPERKREIVARLAADFTVFSEVGSKDDEHIMAPYRWVELIEAELAAGAWKVIAEARESGTAGIFRLEGEVRMGLIDEIVHAVSPDHLIFEAPRRAQQVWFLKRFGREVNLGNIAPSDVLSLETLRLGLRSDTMERES